MNLNLQTNLCDPDRLESFLNGELSDAQEREVTSHLNRCENCRHSLEQQAAEPESWTEAAKYFVASTETIKQTTQLIERYSDRFLFGTDAAAPRDQSDYFKIFSQYDPLWKQLTEPTLRKLRLANYERIFDQARGKVRNWERAHVR